MTNLRITKERGDERVSSSPRISLLVNLSATYALKVHLLLTFLGETSPGKVIADGAITPEVFTTGGFDVGATRLSALTGAVDFR